MITIKHPIQQLSGIALAAVVLLWLTSTSAEEGKPSSPRWEKAIQEFEADDKKLPVAKGGNLFIGSSSIRMWRSLAEDFPGIPVINRGFGGSQIVDSTFFASRVIIPYAPKKIFLYAGDNDIAGGKNAETVLNDFTSFVKTIHQALPKTKIIFIAIKPSLKRWNMADEMTKANHLVNQFTDSNERLGYVDVWTPMLTSDGKPKPNVFIKDGLHMNRTGYEIWTTAIRPFL